MIVTKLPYKDSVQRSVDSLKNLEFLECKGNSVLPIRTLSWYTGMQISGRIEFRHNFKGKITEKKRNDKMIKGFI